MKSFYSLIAIGMCVLLSRYEADAQPPHHTVACEHRTLSLSCPGSHLLRILSGFYGRNDRTTCPHPSILTTSCAATGSLTKLREQCNDRRSCSVRASNSVFGDPCVGTYKYISVHYRCVPGRVVTVCERSSRTVNCPGNQLIQVVRAFYGRDNRQTCPHPSIRTTSCSASGSYQKIRTSCHGRNSCTLSARNQVYGDPCVGTYKYIKMVYNCVAPPQWSPWSPCSHTCGEGSQTRHRGDEVGRRRCNDRPCPSWSAWGAWSGCTRTCGGGTQTSTRSCQHGTAGQYGCPGSRTKERRCNEGCCPHFSDYGAWGACSVTCGGGKQSTSRRCICGNHGDIGCQGSVRSERSCLPQPCPEWGPFGDYSECTASCGGGLQNATRECINGHIGQEGCRGSPITIRPCNQQCCPRWGDFGPYGPCSATCGGGRQMSTRLCMCGETEGTGCVGDDERSQACATQQCPVELTICERHHRNLQCPSGKVINIISGSYGRDDRQTCPHQSIRTTSCSATGALEKIRRVCHNKNSCRLSSNNGVFGDPCVGTYKYIRTDYTCVEPRDRTSILCEGNSNTLSCPGSKVIEVISGFYGRDDRQTCPSSHIRTTTCSASGSLEKLRSACHYKSSCSLSSNNRVFGDPCVGTYKYIKMNYNCIEPRGTTFIACEGRTGSVSCPANQVIEVVSAFYGRDNRHTCPSSSIRTTTCSATESYDKIRTSCHGRNSCTLSPRNQVYGDPCVGTYKYIKMVYNCVPATYLESITCERSRRTISCPSNRVIHVVSGFYGRDNRRTCPHSSIRTTSCSAPGSLQKIRAACHNRQSCTIAANNGVYGDPCVGTYKYVKVVYFCG